MEPKNELRIHLLGGFRVYVGPRQVNDEEWRLRKARALVKLLALAPNHRLHREQVGEILWPELSPQASSNNLRKALHITRRALDPAAANPPYLTFLDELLALQAPSVWTDVEAFEAAAVYAHRSRNPADYQAAVELYEGDLLPEDRYEEWTIQRREDLQTTCLGLLIELAALQEATGDLQAGIESLKRAVSMDRLHEEAHAALMRLYALTGRRTLALRQYQQLREALGRELDTEPGEAATRLYSDISVGKLPASTAPSVPTPAGVAPAQPEPVLPDIAPAAKHNLLVQLTSFVGREREMAEVALLLGATRLLTLVGPGGCGKTRLAIEVGGAALPDFAGRVWLVELASLSEPALLPQVVASALDIREQPGKSLLDTLSDHLRPRKSLLLLDNCEHLVEACASLADVLLRSCPSLQVLATSREPIGIAGETTWPVPSLSLPALSQEMDGAMLLERYEATRLFVERATASSPGFAASARNAQSVANLCHKLDGMPLAIELAAARVRMLSVQQIEERLDHSFQLLASGSRTALPRQRTLVATIDWSYDLLSEEECMLFRRLSVFAGGFDLEAAEAVCAGGLIESDQVLDLLSHLVDKSLVVAHQPVQDEPVRYRLLETLRQYGRARLGERSEAEEAQRRHATYFLALCERAEPELRGKLRPYWLNRLEWELDNLRAALDWWHEHEPELGLRLAGALWRFWYGHSYLNEGRGRLEEMLGRTLDNGNARAKALLGAGMLAWVHGDTHVAYTRLAESVAICRASGEKLGLAVALHFQGHATFDRLNYAEARTLFEESLALFTEIGDIHGQYTLAADVGLVAYHRGDYATARALFEESLTRYRNVHDAHGTGDALNRLGDLARVEGDYAQAASFYEQSLATFRELGDRLGIASALHKLGYIEQHQADYPHTNAFFKESLALQRELGNKQGIIECLAGLAGLDASIGRQRQAMRLFGAVEGLLEANKLPMAPADRVEFDRDMIAARDRLDEETQRRLLAEGRAMTMEQAIEEALRTSDQ